MLKRSQVVAVREKYQGSLLIILARLSRFLEGSYFTESPAESEKSDRFQPGKILRIIEMLAIQSDIARYRCFCAQEALAF